MATTQISGTSVASATIKIYANGTEIVSAATTANSSGAWTATIPAQTVGTTITAKALSGSNGLSIASNAVVVSAESSSSSSGSGTVTPSAALTATSKSTSSDYLLIVALVLFLIAIFMFIKKKTKVAIVAIVLAIIPAVVFFTNK